LSISFQWCIASGYAIERRIELIFIVPVIKIGMGLEVIDLSPFFLAFISFSK